MSNASLETPVDLKLSQLLPIQAGLITPKTELISWGPIEDPISVIPYRTPDQENEDVCLILDGHHRAAKQYLLGKETVSALIIDSDQAVAGSPLASLKFCRTIADVYETYEKHWRPRTLGKGVIDVATLSERLLFSQA